MTGYVKKLTPEEAAAEEKRRQMVMEALKNLSDEDRINKSIGKMEWLSGPGAKKK